MTKTTEIAEELTAALGTRDYSRGARLLAPGAELTAILPGGAVRAVGPERIAEYWVEWLAWADSIDVADVRVSPVGDRVSLSWRCVLRCGDPAVGDRVMEQHLVLDVHADLIERIDLVCTGMRPVPAPPETTVHHFDAGDRGCTDGFPAEFRRRIRAIGLGHQLRVIAADPAAKQDLPSMARLMGHRLVEVAALPDGRTAFTVERAR
jgi:TusA-related sulfurtransferase